MRQVIRDWLTTKRIRVILGHQRLGDSLVYEVYEFMDVDGIFYSFDVVYTKVSILGSVNKGDSLLMLKGDVSEENRMSNKVWETLDSYLVRHGTRDEWVNNRPKKLKNSSFELFISKYLQNLVDNISSINVGRFEVLEVQVFSKDFIDVLVVYSWNNRRQLPIRFNVGSKTAVESKDYGEDSVDFIRFIENIGNICGGTVWY